MTPAIGTPPEAMSARAATPTMTTPIRDVTAIARQFQIWGDVVSASSYGTGHINDTYAVTASQSGRPIRYLLQRINQRVFRDVDGLMANVERVCAHAQRRLIASGTPDASRRALTVIPTRDGRAYHRDEHGEAWRAYLFIEGALGHDVVETEAQAEAAARAFGEFGKLLVDLPGEPLNETIVGFHDTRRRFAAFEDATRRDPMQRADGCRAEIDWAFAHRDLSGALLELCERGDMPKRVTHNDTKLNNVLLDVRTGEGICVIDLDTLMPGLALYDFGDLVRTSTSPVAEDEPEVGRVEMRIGMYRALVRGFLGAAAEILTPAEISHLPLAGMVSTYECGLRFLTDHLVGDGYFKIHRQGHNLDRCRTQFALVDSMQAQLTAMQACARG